MNEQLPCKRLMNCIQFQDFTPSNPNDKLYVNAAADVTVTCPSGTQVTVPIPAGVVGYVLKFQIGDAPYPNLTINCTGGTVSVPVPDNATQAELDALINGMLQTCLSQIAVSIGCQSGQFFNTLQQILNPCLDDPYGNVFPHPAGAWPPGVTAPSTGIDAPPYCLFEIAAGTIQSTISVDDANAKALQLLNEIVSSGNVVCGGPS